jgi:uncharacterized SAM-binding protein YcdF (DUF218 family)
VLFNQIVTWLIAPLGTAWLAWAVAAVLALNCMKRSARALALLAFAWLWCWSTPLASHWLRGQLEVKYPSSTLASMPTAQAIVVLGGAMEPTSATRLWPNLGASADRVWHAARLFHAAKAPWLVMSGGSDASTAATSEAEAMHQFAQDLGVPSLAMLLEGRSRNTRQNAQFTAEILKAKGVSSILLVTSALHMRRAVSLFESQGLTVIPAATDHEARSQFTAIDWLPDAGALEGSARAMKEIVGNLLVSVRI